MSYQVNIFISHSWSYSEHYDKLAEWLFDDTWNYKGTPVLFFDCSVPKDDPIHYAPNKLALQQAIFSKIVDSHIVVIPTGMYAAHSEWIKREIEGSRLYSKPILGVDPWGQQRAAGVVQKASTKVVGWRKQSVADGIWSLFQR